MRNMRVGGSMLEPHIQETDASLLLSCRKSVIRSSPLVGSTRSAKKDESTSSVSYHATKTQPMRVCSLSSSDVYRASTLYSVYSQSTDRDLSDRFASEQTKDKAAVITIVSKTTRKRPSLTRPGVMHVIVKTTYSTGEVVTDTREEETTADSPVIKDITNRSHKNNSTIHKNSVAYNNKGVNSRNVPYKGTAAPQRQDFKVYSNELDNGRVKNIFSNKNKINPRRHCSDRSEYINLWYPNNWEKNFEVFADVLLAEGADVRKQSALQRNISKASRNLSGILGANTYID